MNMVSLVGRLTQDLVLRDNANGDKYLFFTVATNEYRNGQEVAQFVPCVAWGPIAENMSKFLKKGSLVGVSGRLSVRNRQENNQYQTVVNVHANRVEFLDTKNSRAEFKNDSMGALNSAMPDPLPTAAFSPNETKPKPASENSEVVELDDSILWD